MKAALQQAAPDSDPDSWNTSGIVPLSLLYTFDVLVLCSAYQRPILSLCFEQPKHQDVSDCAPQGLKEYLP